MKISSQKLINIPVETESGQLLGVVESFNVDIDSQSILEYNIKPANKVLDLIKNDLIVSRGQVVCITREKIVVEDTCLSDKVEQQQKDKSEEKVPSGISMKNE